MRARASKLPVSPHNSYIIYLSRLAAHCGSGALLGIWSATHRCVRFRAAFLFRIKRLQYRSHSLYSSPLQTSGKSIVVRQISRTRVASQTANSTSVHEEISRICTCFRLGKQWLRLILYTCISRFSGVSPLGIRSAMI